ncbi:MAG: hypothetical protein K2M47_04440 [Clostridiales bacterium]|nr:hypothetical protein [Clostridiales bacterium]
MKNNNAHEVETTGDRLLDVLLDENNREHIVLMDEFGRQLMFEQVAVIPLDYSKGERNVYVILKPVDEVAGINDDEAVVFIIEEDDGGNAVLRVEDDMAVVRKVFNRFYKIFGKINKRG